MAEEMSKLEAVRLALEQLGDASPQELAAFIEERYGVKVQPAVVPVVRFVPPARIQFHARRATKSSTFFFAAMNRSRWPLNHPAR
jgi:hypothetical protein